VIFFGHCTKEDRNPAFHFRLKNIIGYLLQFNNNFHNQENGKDKEMSFSEGLSRFFCGGLIILGIGLAGKSGNRNMAGLLALFPIVTAVGYFFMSRDLEAASIKKIILVSLMGLPTVLAFLLVLYFTIDKMPILKAIVISILAWIITSIGVLGLKKLLF
jgi:uncharacterized membrane protein (GlpM family)